MATQMDATSGAPEVTQQPQKMKRVWFHQVGRMQPISIKVPEDGDVIMEDAVELALTKMKSKVSVADVTVKFSGVELRRSDQISQYSTSEDTPLVLEVSEPEEPPSKKRRTDELEMFYKALKTAEVHDDRFLKLPDGVSFLGKVVLPSELYIRQAYEDLHELIHITYSSRNAFLVTGNPGTGKSFFALYELYYLLKEIVDNKRDAAIVYESVPFGVSLVFRANSVEVLEHAKRPLELPKDTIYYLFDAATKGRVIPSIEKVKTIVFSSPSVTNYQDWMKQRCPQTFYMPVWSLEELQVVCTERTKEDLETLYLVCGGIPRYVIQDLKENPTQDIKAAVAKAQRAIQSLVGNLTLEALKTVAIQLENCAIPDSTSHKLLQIHLHEGEDEKLDYEVPHVYFASQFVQNAIFQQFKSHCESELQSFLARTPHSTGVVGQLFESYAHSHLIAGGEFPVKNLHNLRESKLKLKSLEVKFFKNTDELKQHKGSTYLYLQPIPKNFQSLDSIILLSQTESPIGCQMTISSKHSVKKQGLDKVREALGCMDKHFRLYFVVLPRVFDEWSQPQAYTGSRDYTLRNPKVKNVEQWVLCMKL